LQKVQEISNIHVENKPQPKQNEKGKCKATSNLIEATQLGVCWCNDFNECKAWGIFETIGTHNPLDYFEFILTKWQNVSTFVMVIDFSFHLINNPTCKDKWTTIHGDYYKVKYHMDTIDINVNYWSLLM